MNTPETIYHQLLDSFTSSHVCFALYRLPWTDEPILIMQEEGEPEYIHSLNELNQKKGFLLSRILSSMLYIPDHCNGKICSTNFQVHTVEATVSFQ